MQEKFTVKNVKCGGCVKTIEQGLGGLPGVASVTVTIEGGKVDVTGSGLDRAQIGAKLRELGYPEA
jgi:copper chaperone